MMCSRKVVVMFATCVLVPLLPGSADGAIVSNLWQAFTYNPPEIQVLKDDSVETMMVDNNNNLKLEVGDILVGMFRVDDLENSLGTQTHNADPGWDYEMTGVFQAKVLTKSAASTGSTLDDLDPVTPGPQGLQYDFTFGPSDTLGIGWGGGTMIGLWSDSSDDFDTTGAAGAVGSATGGTPAWEFGFTGAGDTAATGEGWEARAIDDFSLVGLDAVLSELGNYKLSLNLTAEPAIVADLIGKGVTSNVDGSTLVHLSGTGPITENVTSTTVGTTWPVSDRLTMRLMSVPEPVAVARLVGLLGMGLISAVWCGFRRKRR